MRLKNGWGLVAILAWVKKVFRIYTSGFSGTFKIEVDYVHFLVHKVVSG